MDLTELNISRFLRLNSDPDTDIADMNADLVNSLKLFGFFGKQPTRPIRHNMNLRRRVG